MFLEVLIAKFKQQPSTIKQSILYFTVFLDVLISKSSQNPAKQNKIKRTIY